MEKVWEKGNTVSMARMVSALVHGLRPAAPHLTASKSASCRAPGRAEELLPTLKSARASTEMSLPFGAVIQGQISQSLPTPLIKLARLPRVTSLQSASYTGFPPDRCAISDTNLATGSSQYLSPSFVRMV